MKLSCWKKTGLGCWHCSLYCLNILFKIKIYINNSIHLICISKYLHVYKKHLPKYPNRHSCIHTHRHIVTVMLAYYPWKKYFLLMNYEIKYCWKKTGYVDILACTAYLNFSKIKIYYNINTLKIYPYPNSYMHINTCLRTLADAHAHVHTDTHHHEHV